MHPKAKRKIFTLAHCSFLRAPYWLSPRVASRKASLSKEVRSHCTRLPVYRLRLNALIGLTNISVMQEVISSQTLGYVFPFSQFSFPTDISCVVLSEGKKSAFFKVPELHLHHMYPSNVTPDRPHCAFQAHVGYAVRDIQPLQAR